MTINFFALKGDLNGKTVVVRFFFVGYILTADETYHGTQHIKRIFWCLAVLISNF